MRSPTSGKRISPAKSCSMPAAVAGSMAPVVPAPPVALAPARQFPVLTDVVDPSEVSGTGKPVALRGAADGSSVGANDPVHDLPEERQRAHRSRLKRMKERGLFKNE